MPQKKTTRKSTAKKRRTTKKPKVYIPAYKVIIFCCIIITLCMSLLLLTTLKTSDTKIASSITERYQEDKATQKTETPKEKESPAKKTEPAPAAKKAETKKPETTKSEPVKSEPAKSEPAKIETPQVKEENNKQPEKTEKTIEQKTPSVPVIEKPKSKYNFPAAKNGAQLIFVFDDGGQNLGHLSPFLKLPFPITVAVLPQLAHSKETAAQVRASKNEVILHQPMQAVNAAVNPGPGAIKPEMSENQIISLLFQNITEIGPIAGMNNHEGSAITADAEKMAIVLQFCSQEGIYFLDSRTNVETKVPYVAGELGYSYYERNIFLDNVKTNENALKELKKGLDLANKNGSVIMIGHIWSADFLPAFLQDVYPELKAQGYSFSTVSKSKAKRN